MRLRTILALAPLAALVACGGNPDAARPITSGAGPAADMEMTDDEVAALPRPPGVTEPARLKGLNPLQVKAVLGKPVFTRRDAPAEIWQYRGRSCTLDVFFYDDKNGQSVVHYAVRGAQPVNEKDCFEDLTVRSRGTPTS